MSRKTPRPFQLDYCQGQGQEGVRRARNAIVTEHEDAKAFAAKIRAREAVADEQVAAILRGHREAAQR